MSGSRLVDGCGVAEYQGAADCVSRLEGAKHGTDSVVLDGGPGESSRFGRTPEPPLPYVADSPTAINTKPAYVWSLPH